MSMFLAEKKNIWDQVAYLEEVLQWLIGTIKVLKRRASHIEENKTRLLNSSILKVEVAPDTFPIEPTDSINASKEGKGDLPTKYAVEASILQSLSVSSWEVP